MAYSSNLQQVTLHNIMHLWRGGFEQSVRCRDLNYYSLIWRRSSGRTLGDTPHGYITGYHHRDMYLANHGCLLSRNNILRERLRIYLNYILLVLSVGLISRKLGDPVRVMAISDNNMVSLLATMMNRDHYSLGYIFQRVEYLNYMTIAI